MEEKYIEKTLKSIKAQDYTDYEIIVADSSSSDRTVEIARKYADNVIVSKNRGVSLGRNLGAENANGNILLFLDADIVLRKNFLSEIKKAFERKKIVCVSGYVKSYGNHAHRFIFRSMSEILYFLSKIRKPSFSGMCFSIKKDIFNKIGGFDENLQTTEDWKMTKYARKYGRCVLVRKAKCVTSPRRLIGMGTIKGTSFHIINYIQNKMFGKAADVYSIEREG